MRLTRPLIGAAALVCLTLASCIQSDNPISPLDGSQPDAKLYGVWMAKDWTVKDSDDLNYYCVSKYPKGQDVPEGLMRVVCFGVQNGKVNADDSPAYVARIGEVSYLQLINTSDDGCYQHGKSKVSRYTFLKYRVDGNTCEVSGCDEDFVEDQIKQKHIQGESNNLSMWLTDSTENLRKWLVENDAKIFKAPEMVLTRMPMKSTAAGQR